MIQGGCPEGTAPAAPATRSRTSSTSTRSPAARSRWRTPGRTRTARSSSSSPPMRARGSTASTRSSVASPGAGRRRSHLARRPRHPRPTGRADHDRPRRAGLARALPHVLEHRPLVRDVPEHVVDVRRHRPVEADVRPGRLRQVPAVLEDLVEDLGRLALPVELGGTAAIAGSNTSASQRNATIVSGSGLPSSCSRPARKPARSLSSRRAWFSWRGAP